ncbi:SnoaL-like protein [Micromonospora sp. Llam0]|uniref:nuclear transport factor 2 family protein n=1 Tax=Micromonospora sp. Llam0 TaxID=2485143 RepID=UPI000F49DE8E|nr:nuclear transport factor 2 family protein [Micromonospora sp. Llam0]ROO52002.1 SnoaL-like protein [Micromonospora sp. Llam0]
MNLPPRETRAHLDTTVARFRRAMQDADFDALDGLFAEDVRFNSPRAAKPVQGVRAISMVLWSAMSNFKLLRYVGHVGPSAGGADRRAAETHVLLFDAVGVRGAKLNGVDIIELDRAGRICALTVMLRPLDSIAAVRRLGAGR